MAKFPLSLWIAICVTPLLLVALLWEKEWAPAGGLIAVFVISFLVTRHNRRRRPK